MSKGAHSLLRQFTKPTFWREENKDKVTRCGFFNLSNDIFLVFYKKIYWIIFNHDDDCRSQFYYSLFFSPPSNFSKKKFFFSSSFQLFKIFSIFPFQLCKTSSIFVLLQMAILLSAFKPGRQLLVAVLVSTFSSSHVKTGPMNL